MKTSRRNFLKYSALFGAAATSFPVQYALAQENSAAQTDVPDPHFPVRFNNIQATAPKPRVITIPNVGNYKVLKGDFHVHTLLSDGQVMPRQRVLEAVSNGLDCISLTEHITPNGVARGVRIGGTLAPAGKENDHNLAYDLAKPDAEKQNLILVRGTEITLPEWHLNALFLNDVNPVATKINNLKEVLAAVADQGGFVSWNHPTWTDRTPDDDIVGLKRGEPMRFFDEIEEVRAKGYVHGIEVFNGLTHFPIALDWCNERNLVPMTVSDIHPSELDRYGVQNLCRPMTLVFAEERTEESIREAFFAQRIVGWAADMILGKPEWVGKLFAACVDVSVSDKNVTIIKNKSDIPMHLKMRESKYDLKPQDEVTIVNDDVADKLIVTNWRVGSNKHLEIPFKTLFSSYPRSY